MLTLQLPPGNAAAAAIQLDSGMMMTFGDGCVE
jgi:hypothetical protein